MSFLIAVNSRYKFLKPLYPWNIPHYEETIYIINFLLRSFYSIFNVNFQNNYSNVINLHQSILVLLLRLMTFSPRSRVELGSL